MAKSRRIRTLAGITAVAIILIALSLLLLRCNSADDDSNRSAGKKDTSIERSENGSPTADSGESPPNVVDTPSNPRTSGAKDADSTADDDSDAGSGAGTSGGGASGGSGTKPGSGTYTYAMYLADTKRNVVTRSDGLTAAVNDAIADIANGDATGLLGTYALDEGALPGDAESLISGYPAFVDSQLSSTVNVYSVGGATVYFGFAVVEWEDGGVLSRHTIGVPLRLINGVWCLSTIDLDTPGLTFVQSIQI